MLCKGIKWRPMVRERDISIFLESIIDFQLRDKKGGKKPQNHARKGNKWIHKKQKSLYKGKKKTYIPRLPQFHLCFSFNKVNSSSSFPFSFPNFLIYDFHAWYANSKRENLFGKDTSIQVQWTMIKIWQREWDNKI